MGKVRSIGFLGCLLSFALSPFGFADKVIISEMMALNREVLKDRNSEFSDWVEIFNGRPEAVNLDGWHLTDDPEVRQKWAFPAVVLPPNGFLVVFASRKSIAIAGRELHTNFRIDSDGEFLGLVRPDDTFASALPRFPRQITDSSYGFWMETVTTEILPTGRLARYFVPMRARELDSDWNGADFDDSAWAEGVARFGFDVSEDPVLGDLIETDVGELMHRENASLFMRIPLEIPDPVNTTSLRLRAQYNDGFVAYINGVEVARRNARNTRYNSGSDEERPIEHALVEEDVDLVIPVGVLRADRNVLAIQAMNRRSSNTNFLFIPAVDVINVTSVGSEARYFADPSPWTPNTSTPFDGVSQPPVLAPGSTSFVETLRISITAESADAVIRYTLDGSRPDETSSVYEGPFEIRQLSPVQARSFEPGKLPSETVQETYLRVSQSLADEFSSNIPVVVVTTRGRITDRLITRMHMQIIEGNDEERATLTGGSRHFSGYGAIKTRGSSTGSRRKSSYGFEIQDEVGDDLDVSLLGMPEESDWILYGAYNFDRALVRNPFMYELSNQVGRYAVRCRFCEVFIHIPRSSTPASAREITSGSYMGVYSLCEKIKQGPGRVDIDPILPSDEREPEVSGGYVLKIDRPDHGDSGVTAGGQRILFVDPKEREVAARQKTWVRRYFDRLGASLRDTRAVDRPADIFDRSYTQFLDVDSWIDHHILNEFSKNPDEFVLSTYFFKPRNGPVEFGPIWDFDRALGPDDDGRAANPVGWSGQRQTGWWGLLFRDGLFLERYRTRWVELRQGPMSTSNMHSIVDSMAAEIREAQGRNNDKWRLVTRAGWEAEVQQLKTWIERRGEWIDSQFISLPELSHLGGPVSPGFEVKMRSPEGLAVYFTLDGSDPRGFAGPSENAILFETPLVIEENTRIQARASGLGSSWSGLVEAFYVTSSPPLVITEIMYNPPSFEGDEFRQSWSYEFVEFQNVGTEPLDVTGYQWVEPRVRGARVKFDFTEGGLTTVSPGEIVVVARNLEAFRERYGDELSVFGEMKANLRNSGETIRIADAKSFPVSEFRYEDDWDTSTDGFGKSLVIRNAHGAPETWSVGGSWRASAEIGGSPGRVDPGSGGQLVADVNLDGRRSVTDAVALLLAISGKSSFPCGTAEANKQLLDANGDGSIDISDAVHLLDFLFRSGASRMLDSECVEIGGCRTACGR